MPNLSLHARLAIALVCLSVLPAAAIRYLQHESAREALVREARSDLLQVARRRAAALRVWLRERRSDVDELARSRECVLHAAGSEHACREARGRTCDYLAMFTARKPGVSAAVLLDAAGGWLGSSSEDSRGWLEPTAHSLDTPNGGPLLAPGARQPTLLWWRELRRAGAAGPSVGRVLLAATPPLAEPKRATLPATPIRDVVLPLDGASGNGQAILEHCAARMRRTDEGICEYRTERGRMIGAYIILPDVRLAAIAEIDRRSLLGSPHRTLWRDVSLDLSTVAVVALAGVIVAGWLTSPLQRLAALSRAPISVTDGAAAAANGGTAPLRAALAAMLDELGRQQEHRIRLDSLARVGSTTCHLLVVLRRSMAAIRADLDQLLRTHETGPDRELGEIALEQLERMQHKLADLERYGEAVTVCVAPTPVDVLLAEARALSAATLARGEQTLEIRASHELVATLDRALVAQALANLLTNASQASPPRSPIVLEAECTDDTLMLRVSDRGPGVSPAIRERVFQPFSTTRREGTGLGLAMVLRVAQLHGGTANHAARAGGGASFSIVIPQPPLCRGSSPTA